MQEISLYPTGSPGLKSCGLPSGMVPYYLADLSTQTPKVQSYILVASSRGRSFSLSLHCHVRSNKSHARTPHGHRIGQHNFDEPRCDRARSHRRVSSGFAPIGSNLRRHCTHCGFRCFQPLSKPRGDPQKCRAPSRCLPRVHDKQWESVAPFRQCLSAESSCSGL